MKNAILFFSLCSLVNLNLFTQTEILPINHGNSCTTLQKGLNDNLYFSTSNNGDFGPSTYLYSYKKDDPIKSLYSGDGSLEKIQILDDTTFLAIINPGQFGYPFLRYYDEKGNLINSLNKISEVNPLTINTTDDGRLFSFIFNDSLVQINEELDILQSYPIENLGLPLPESLEILEDNHLILILKNTNEIARFDTLGKLHWRKDLPTEFDGNIIQYQLIDSEYYFLTKADNYSITKMDTLGNILNQMEIQDTCSQCDFSGFFRGQDESFYLYGKVNHWEVVKKNNSFLDIILQPNFDFLALKLNPEGQVEFIKMMGDSLGDELVLGLQGEGDNLIFCAHQDGILLSDEPQGVLIFEGDPKLVITGSNFSDWKDLEYYPQPIILGEEQSENSNDAYKIAPNPADKNIIFRVPKENQYELKIFGMGGDLMHEIAFENETNVNLRGFSQGVYIYYLKNLTDSEAKLKIGKFMVN